MSSDSLERITALARIMIDRERAVNSATADLSSRKAELEEVKRGALPDLMRELEIESIKLTTGETVSVKDDVKAAIPAARRDEAIQWLTERGYDGIVKTQLIIEYERGEREVAESHLKILQEMLCREGRIECSVHPQTLAAFVRERMEAGETIPFDIFGIFPFSEAKIKTSRI